MLFMICCFVAIFALVLIFLLWADSIFRKVKDQNQKYYERVRELCYLQEKHYQTILYEITKLTKEIEKRNFKT